MGPNQPHDDTGDRDTPTRTLREERELGPMRRTIAERLSESYRDAVHVTVHREIDAEALTEAIAMAQGSVELSVLDVLLSGVSEALDAHPEFNATFEDGVHRLYAEHNIAVAVAVEGGLVTPVIEDVANRSVTEIAQERERLTQRVLAGDYTMSELQGSTFTVSNLGVLDVDSFTPIINPPEIAILGVSRLRQRATPSEGAVAFRRQLPLDLSFDHRVVDGAAAARFLGTLADRLSAAPDIVSDDPTV